MRVAALFLGLLPVLALAAPAAPDAVATNRLIRRADPVMTIDGKLDEACWRQAEAHNVNYINGRKGEAAADPLMTVKWTWDTNYLYIGYETFETNVTAFGTGVVGGPADNSREAANICVGPECMGGDVVEFFISWRSQLFMWELHHNASNNFSDIWCVVLPENDPQTRSTDFSYGIRFAFEEYLRDDGTFRVASAVALKARADGKPSTINDPRDADTGYTSELRLPWRAIGAPIDYLCWRTEPGPNPDRPLRLPAGWDLTRAEVWMLAVLQNPDTGRRYHHDGPEFFGGWFHRGAATWPRYRFEK